MAITEAQTKPSSFKKGDRLRVKEGRFAGLVGTIGVFEDGQFNFLADGYFDLWFCPSNLETLEQKIEDTAIAPVQDSVDESINKQMLIGCRVTIGDNPYHYRHKQIGEVVAVFGECVRVRWEQDGQTILYAASEVVAANLYF